MGGLLVRYAAGACHFSTIMHGAEEQHQLLSNTFSALVS